MKSLFSLNQDGIVVALPQAWLYSAFDDIRTKYKEPGIAAVELGLVYFAADYRSEYVSIKDVRERVKKIKEQVYGNRKITIDAVTYAAILFYEQEQSTPRIRLIKALNGAVVKAITVIETTEFEDLKDIKELAEISAKLPSMMESLAAVEKAVKKESAVEEGVSGSGQKGAYEDD